MHQRSLLADRRDLLRPVPDKITQPVTQALIQPPPHLWRLEAALDKRGHWIGAFRQWRPDLQTRSDVSSARKLEPPDLCQDFADGICRLSDLSRVPARLYLAECLALNPSHQDVRRHAVSLPWIGVENLRKRPWAGDQLVKVHFFLARGWVSRVSAQYKGFLQPLDMQPVHDIDQPASQWLERFQSVPRKFQGEKGGEPVFGR